MLEEIFAIVLIVFVVIMLLPILRSIFTIQQAHAGIIERFGKFHRVVEPGLHVKLPYVDRLVTLLSLKIEQNIITADTKTKDNVFVKVNIAVNYRVVSGREREAYYTLSDAKAQIQAYVLDVVRSKIPGMTLDEVFERKDDVAQAVTQHLSELMQQYGFEIVSSLVVDVQPDSAVVAAMNEIQAQSRLQVAAQAKAEANKILAVKAAEAEAESKALQGKGIADQRKAIVAGLNDSVASLASAAQTTPAEVLRTLLMTQYFDTIREIGVQSGAKVILLPHSPSGMTEIGNQIRDAMIVANEEHR
ncbi:SPFH domain-containing protein [uncultured Methylovirgula sp.]|uniref:SPFH domain-containing protein n=1 Tax=uncultured Methylovirgula sp. TaxID=1285960 RepID=UPI0026186AC7|nr:SPFH domain-containing protein [uncultured Methylovirgula sp.]